MNVNALSVINSITLSFHPAIPCMVFPLNDQSKCFPATIWNACHFIMLGEKDVVQGIDQASYDFIRKGFMPWCMLSQLCHLFQLWGKGGGEFKITTPSKSVNMMISTHNNTIGQHRQAQAHGHRWFRLVKENLIIWSLTFRFLKDMCVCIILEHLVT